MEKNIEVAPEDTITLKVLGQDNTFIMFKMRKNTPFKKLMKSYCERTGLVMEETRFRFDGEGVKENDTPSSFNMENFDIIEIFQVQIGG